MSKSAAEYHINIPLRNCFGLVAVVAAAAAIDCSLFRPLVVDRALAERNRSFSAEPLILLPAQNNRQSNVAISALLVEAVVVVAAVAAFVAWLNAYSICR